MIRIDFHLHSRFSGDGVHSLEELVTLLSRRRVAVAALTDHDSLAGQARFRDLLRARGIGFLSGVELSATSRWGEVHLLAYGFDLEDAGLRDLMAGDRPARPLEKCLEVVHQAGGKVFLAHPLTLDQDWSELESTIEALAGMGLDGLEVFYAAYPVRDQEKLLRLADRLGLLASGGSDFHDHEQESIVGVDMPLQLWKNFHASLAAAPADGAEIPPAKNDQRGLHWGSFFARILLPTLVSLVLFVLTLFFVLIPTLENILLERKKEMIRELTNSAASILAEYHAEEVRGELTPEEARRAAIVRIQNLRYGKEGKDYFWIIDSHPRMIMHPYRPELNRTDVSDYRDSQGARVFEQFVKAVEESDAGYVEYFWQWKDDQSRIVPKLSYVKKFPPWDWIIGTGIYLEDVEREISDVTQSLIRLIVIITIVLGLLLAFVVQQSLGIEKSRSAAENALRNSHEKYRSLVEASTEGAMILTRGRCRYSNKTMQEMLRCTEAEMFLLDAADMIAPAAGESGEAEGVAGRLARNELLETPVEVRLQARSGKPASVVLATSPIHFAGEDGLIVTARKVGEGRKKPRAPLTEGSRERALEREIALLRHGLSGFTRRVVEVMRPPATCAADTPIPRVAALMKQSGSSAVVVIESGRPLGVITGRDLRERAAPGTSATLAHEIMSAPVVGIPREGLVQEAMALMRARGVDCLVVRDHEAKACGLLHALELLRIIDCSHQNLPAQIDACVAAEDLRELVDRQREAVAPMIRGSHEPAVIAKILTGTLDRISVKACELAVAELGPPPVPFAFIGLGSHGREELTLASDQDNAIIYEGDETAAAEPAGYFSVLGAKVCGWLHDAGYLRCSGDNMASNPRWCLSLGEWKTTFLDWIRNPDNQELLEFNIFFDFRHVHGEARLVDALRRHVDAELKDHPPFFIHAAQNTQHYRSPIGPFGNLITTANDTGDRILNLKAALLQIINFARIHALANGLHCTNTLTRLGDLRDLEILQPPIHEEAVQSFNHLTAIRLRSQLRRGADPSRRGVRIDELTSLEHSMLKQIFAHLNLLNKNISSHFLGG